MDLWYDRAIMKNNNTLLVQEFLKHKSLNQLKAEHGINFRRDGNKMSLNYDQIESRESDPLAKQCRGLILAFDIDKLDMDNFANAVIGETVVLARPFDRFFNYGQEAAANINFDKEKDIRYWEKLDGSCIIFYWDPYKDMWCSATRGIPEANLPIDGFDEYTFTSLFQKAVKDTVGVSYQDWLNNCRNTLNIYNTYVFELTTPYNRIVVKYNDCRIHVLGIRDTKTGVELDPEVFAPFIDVPVCPSYKLETFADMLRHVSVVNPLEHEGIVACTKDFRRVKIKSPSYVAYNRIRDQVANSPRALIQIILDEKLDDFMQVLPSNYLEKAVVYQDKLREIVKSFDIQYNHCMSEVNKMGVMSDKVRQKQFALEAQHNKYWLAPMMTIFNGKHKNLRDYFNSQKIHGGEYKVSFLNFLVEKFDK